MIFVTLGTQKFQFNRLLKEIDKLIEDGVISDEVFAQTGGSDYMPIHYKYSKFLSHEETEALQKKADLIITHGGSGSIIEALKKGKKIIAVARLAKYGEHVDDHQTEIIGEFAKNGYLIGITDTERLKDAIYEAKNLNVKSYKSSPDRLIGAIAEIIDGR